MPSISAHMAVAKEVSLLLNINSKDFIKGNILPDIILLEDSHHKIKYKEYMIPDINYFTNKLNLNNYLQLGYFTHILLDYHFLKDYLSSMYPDKDIFIDGKIYKDYDYLNDKIIKYFNLDVEAISTTLTNFNCKIDNKKLKYNIECLKKNTLGNTTYLDYNSFINFLSKVSVTISKELIYYENKSS